MKNLTTKTHTQVLAAMLTLGQKFPDAQPAQPKADVFLLSFDWGYGETQVVNVFPDEETAIDAAITEHESYMAKYGEAVDMSDMSVSRRGDNTYIWFNTQAHSYIIHGLVMQPSTRVDSSTDLPEITQRHHTHTDQHLRKTLAREFVGDFELRPTKKAGKAAVLREVHSIRRHEKQQWKKELLAELATS